jgi:hypothetical protein
LGLHSSTRRGSCPSLRGFATSFLKHHFLAQGPFAADLVDLAHLQSPDFVKRLNEGEVWGSPGSIADVAGLRPFDPVDAETERDSVELRRSLIELADQMREQGISSERPDVVARAFREGLEMHESGGDMPR